MPKATNNKFLSRDEIISLYPVRFRTVADLDTTSQLDVKIASEERKTEIGRTRWMLSGTEVDVLRARQLIGRVIEMSDNGMSVSEISDETGLTVPETTRILAASNDRSVVEQECRRVIRVMLDFENPPKTREEIAERANVTVRRYIQLQQTDEWVDIYNEMFAGLQNDPRINATRDRLLGMLPTAITSLYTAMVDETAPASSRISAAKEIIKLSGFSPMDAVETDRKQLIEFLSGIKKSGSDPVAIPEEYEVILGEYSDLDRASDESSEDED